MVTCRDGSGKVELESSLQTSLSILPQVSVQPSARGAARDGGRCLADDIFVKLVDPIKIGDVDRGAIVHPTLAYGLMSKFNFDVVRIPYLFQS